MKNELDTRLYEAFSREAELPAALNERLADCYARIRQDSRKGESMKQDHTSHRRTLRTVLAVAAAICVLAGAALAVADYSGFFESAFGDGIAAQPARTVEYTAADGSTKTESYPAIDRAPVDTEQADALIGDYVRAVGQSVTLRGYTFTIRECVMDENGIGAVTIDVENPNGVSQQTVFDGANGEMPPYSITFRQGADGFDDRGFIDEASSTDTCVRWVYYLIAKNAPDSDITAQMGVRNEESNGEKAPLYETAELTIAQAEFVPAERFTGGEFEAELSPVGLTLRVTDADTDISLDLIEKELVIRYSDGSEYTVVGDDVLSSSVAHLRSGGEVCWSFNRLVDVENVTEIYLRGYYYKPVVIDMDGMTESPETPANPAEIEDPAITDFDLTLTR